MGGGGVPGPGPPRLEEPVGPGDAAVRVAPESPESPERMAFTPPPQSHARTAFLERERAEWRQHVEEDPKRARVAAVVGGGPTVEDYINIDEYSEGPPDDPSEEGTWTPAEELEAKTKHLREAIDGNDSYEVVPGGTAGGLRLTTTWVIAIRDGVLKARLCARDFAKTKSRLLYTSPSPRD